MHIQEIIQSIRNVIRIITQPEISSKNFLYCKLNFGKDTTIGQYVIIFHTSLQNTPNSYLNESQLNEYLQQHITNRSFIHPNDPEFSLMINYFVVNYTTYLQSTIKICQNLEHLSESLCSNQWISNQIIFQSEDSQNPKVVTHLMNRQDTIAFIFQIFDLKKAVVKLEADPTQMNEYEADLQKLRQELLRKSEECETLQKELNQIQNHEGILNLQISKSQQFIAQLEAENQHLKENNSQTLDQIDQTNTQTSEFQNQIVELEKSIRNMKLQMFDYLEGKKKAEETKKQAEDSYRQISDENTIIKNKFGELERNIVELNAQTTQLKTKNKDLEDRLKQERDITQKTQEQEKNERTTTLNKLREIQNLLKTSIEDIEKGPDESKQSDDNEKR